MKIKNVDEKAKQSSKVNEIRVGRTNGRGVNEKKTQIVSEVWTTTKKNGKTKLKVQMVYQWSEKDTTTGHIRDAMFVRLLSVSSFLIKTRKNNRHLKEKIVSR